MSLSIGLLHLTSPPVVGGVETVLQQHARLIADAGYAVRMITGRGGRPDPRAELARLPAADTRNAAIRAAQSLLDVGIRPAGFDHLIDRIVDELVVAFGGLDVVIAHNVCSLGMNVPLTAAVHRLVADGSIRGFVAWNHDIAATSARHSARLHPGYPWDLFRQPWPRTLTVTISEARRVELAAATGMPVDAIRVVPNGIDRVRFLGLAPATLRLVDALGLRAASPVLLTPARVTPRKNLELAIAVTDELRRAGDGARLLITGAPDPHDPQAVRHIDELRDRSRAKGVAGSVHLLVDGPADWRSNRVVADLFRLADVLFLPSRDEGFGLPVLEAAVCRLPVVCADIPALRELAGENATYFDPAGDPARAAALVRERLAADPAQRLAARARSYDWNALFTSHIQPLLLEAAG